MEFHFFFVLYYKSKRQTTQNLVSLEQKHVKYFDVNLHGKWEKNFCKIIRINIIRKFIKIKIHTFYKK